jgi:hypothetical protein
MDKATLATFRQRLLLMRQAERQLGRRSWFLLSCYGRLMTGPHSGSYVSGVPFAVQRELVQQLTRGEIVPVHLMHKHVSGSSESSSLRWSPGSGFVMVFPDRQEEA